MPLTEPIAKAYQAGVPVIVLDRRVMGDQYTQFIGADNKKSANMPENGLPKRLAAQGKLSN